MLKYLLTLIVVAWSAAASAQVATNNAVYGRDGVSAVIGKVTALNLNQTNTDNAVTINLTKYIVRKVTVTNCSISLAANLATIGVFSSTGGGGSTLVALALVQSLTATTKFVDMTIALTADTLTATTLYVRNGVTAGTAATCDVYIVADVLP